MASRRAELHKKRSSSLSRQGGCKLGLPDMIYTKLPQSFFLLLQIRCQQTVPRGQHLPREIAYNFLPSAMLSSIYTQTWELRQKQADPRSHLEVLPVQAPPKHPRQQITSEDRLALASCAAVLGAAGQPPLNAHCSPNLFSEPCIQASSLEELHHQSHSDWRQMRRELFMWRRLSF